MAKSPEELDAISLAQLKAGAARALTFDKATTPDKNSQDFKILENLQNLYNAVPFDPVAIKKCVDGVDSQNPKVKKACTKANELLGGYEKLKDKPLFHQVNNEQINANNALPVATEDTKYRSTTAIEKPPPAPEVKHLDGYYKQDQSIAVTKPADTKQVLKQKAEMVAKVAQNSNNNNNNNKTKLDKK